MKLSAALVALLLLTAGSSANAAITVNRVGSTGAVTVGVNEEVTISLNIRNPTSTGIFGLGFSAHGYDEAVADFVSGRAVRRYLNDGEGTYLPNLSGTSSGGTGIALQRVLAESAIGANGNRVQFALSAATSEQIGIEPSIDPGIDGNVGTAQFNIIFKGVAEGQTTIHFDTAYQGDLVNLAGGADEEGVGFDVVINVPEPSAVAAGAASLASVLGVIAVRRRL